MKAMESSLQKEVEALLDEHFPAGMMPSRVDAAVIRGDARIVTESVPPLQIHLQSDQPDQPQAVCLDGYKQYRP